MKKYLALKASAGSGKTFALTVRYITLLLKGAKPNEILALTFTNKAANEMSQRVFNTLKNLGNDKIYLEQISLQSGLSFDDILEKKSYLIEMYLNSELSIYTIDKFVNKILREFSGYLGITDDFEIKQDNVESLSYKFLQSLNEVEFDKLIEFASYESKKFNSIFDLFMNLYEKNEDFNIVDIEASLINLQKDEALKIAYKLKEHILNCDGASASAKKAVDFDSFNSLLFKGKTWLTKASSTDSRDFKKCSNEIFEKSFQALKIEISNYYKLRASYSLSSIYKLFISFKKFKKKYNKNKNYFTFTDISNYTYELLNEKIDKEFLYFRLDSIYNHILIDEFQDTSLLQYKILKPLIDECISGQSERFKTFFYVGDTKQSIYRFRGGKKELFDYVSNTFPQIEIEPLNTNYRSTKEVVDFVNDLFLKLPTYEYIEQKSVIPDGYVEVINDENLIEEEKFKNVASTIAMLLRSKIDPNTIAVLTYTNDDVLELYSYLKKIFPSLKVTTEMTSKLINQENVKACINAIKYLYYGEKIYLENLNAIIGNELGSEIDISFDLHENKVFELVKKVALKLDLIDDNIVKLIEECNKFANLVDFIYEIDNLETPIPNKEQTGLQILTIFKSKGLEFDTVILLDRIKNKNHDRSSLLFEYENIKLKNVYYKISNLDSFDENYKKAQDKEKVLQYEDEINILYVALTRAKNNMFIFKKEEKSVFDKLDLKAMKRGTLLIEQNKKKEFIKTQKVEYKPLNLGRQKVKAMINDEEEFDLTSRYFGIATHYCLEMMNSFTVSEIEFAIQLSKSRFSNFLKDEVFEDIQKRVTFLIENEMFKHLVENASFSTEQSLIYNDELKIIDLLIKKEDKYIIIDYKTTINEKDEHKSQVLFYKKAIKDIVKSENVDAYLAYLKDDGAYLRQL